MWAYESVFYQIYPLGFCGAPFENDGQLQHRILKVEEWIPHIKKLECNAVYFSPLFESDTHGYNTRDFQKLDCRLGTNEDFKQVVDKLHAEGIKVVLDGVFNHVGRGFFGFQDVLQNRENSTYKDWFKIDFWGNSPYNDGLYYEGWEGKIPSSAKSYMIYQEGIYVGYKYYETRYEDYVNGRTNVGNYDYDNTVIYPFGYGLSYTDFKYDQIKCDKNELTLEEIEAHKTFNFSIEISNIGEYDGFETVQLYIRDVVAKSSTKEGRRTFSYDFYL